MKLVMLKNQTIYLLFGLLLVLIYLILGSGLHGDDYVVISNFRSSNFGDFITINVEKIMKFNIATYYSFWFFYFSLGEEHQWVYDSIKIVSHA
ncbi:hypothetical protein HOB87_05310, partial [Candidatus Woesearchaeota archaeon]|nr:hypothetical protein [Candidatus Woesearchaeota archaeon]